VSQTDGQSGQTITAGQNITSASIDEWSRPTDDVACGQSN